MNWWIFALVYLLVGLLYLVIGGIAMFVHYARIFGIEKTAAAMQAVADRLETSWAIVPFNLALWPWRFTYGLVEIIKELHDILYNEEVKEGT